MPSLSEIRKFDLNQYESWAPVVASFIADQDPTAPPDFYNGQRQMLENGDDSAHYGYFVDDEIVAVAGLCESHFNAALDRHLYVLVGESDDEYPKSQLLRHVERETHAANFPMVTALIGTGEYRFFRQNGYRPRKVDAEDTPLRGHMYVCKYISVDQVVRVRFAQARSA